jgi:hypothetical protein
MWPFKKANTTSDQDSFGNIAVQMRYVTPEAVREASRQQEICLPLGEILVRMGAMSEYQKQEVLLEQEKRRSKMKNKEGFFELKRQRLLVRHLHATLQEMTASTTLHTAQIADFKNS